MSDVFEKDKGGVTLKIRLNPKLLERLFYIAVIIVLAVLLFLGTFCDTKCEIADKPTEETQQTEITTTEETTQEAEEQEAAAETTEEVGGEPDVNETVEETTEEPEINETVEEEPEPEPVSYSGDVELTINDVMTELKNEGTYGKVTGVRFTINNEKEDFMPKVEVYTYEDGDTSSVFARMPREERVYSTLKLGQENSYELSIASQQFVDLDDYIICKVRVIDKSSDELLIKAEEKFKITG